MPVFSKSDDRDIFSYCSTWLLSEEDTELWDHSTATVNQTHPSAGICSHLIGTYKKLRIPTFQRGIEWDFDNLLECIYSKSRTLGIVVIGRANNIPSVDFILDGLQRFATFNYLLHKLDDVLFKRPTAADPNPWNFHISLTTRPSLNRLQNIAVQHTGQRGRFQYNHTALKLLSRKVVSNTYQSWCLEADDEIDRLRNPQNSHFDVAKAGEFLDALADFTEKPLFTQELHGFANLSELLATFRGLNTIRVELTSADVCRSVLIDGMLGAGSPQKDVLEVDNTFNETLLTPTGRIKQGLSPLVKVLEYEWVDRGNSALAPSLFTNPLVAASIKGETDAFFQWMTQFARFRSTSNYLDFIGDIGDNPYVATLLYYYHRFKAAGTLTNPPPDSELHQLSLAYFRRMLDGGVGDTLPITKLVGTNTIATLPDFLQRVNPPRAGSLGSQVHMTWLKNSLDEIRGMAAAKIVFNACLLPQIRISPAPNFGGSFTPVVFERGSNNWQIDHLIPENSFGQPLSPGDPYRDSLRNFCPVIGSDNASYGARDCAQKLDLNGSSYVTYRTDPRKLVGGIPHLYIDQLLNKQGTNGGNVELNNRDWLINASAAPVQRCYGDERLDLIVDLLLTRI